MQAGRLQAYVLMESSWQLIATWERPHCRKIDRPTPTFAEWGASIIWHAPRMCWCPVPAPETHAKTVPCLASVGCAERIVPSVSLLLSEKTGRGPGLRANPRQNNGVTRSNKRRTKQTWPKRRNEEVVEILDFRDKSPKQTVQALYTAKHRLFAQKKNATRVLHERFQKLRTLQGHINAKYQR